jgi:alpha-glucuronidase
MAVGWMMRSLTAGLLALALAAPLPAAAEDGYDLWLRYAPLADDRRQRAAGRFRRVVTTEQSPATTVAVDELRRGLSGLFGEPVAASSSSNGDRDGTVVLGTPESLNDIGLSVEIASDHRDAFAVVSRTLGGDRLTLVAGHSDVAQLYGAFALLRYLAGHGDPDRIDLESAPRIDHRLLNHWDNLDRTVERGYAGQSLWDWTTLPEYRDRRYTDYARANASIGINGTVLNNVNDLNSLSPLTTKFRKTFFTTLLVRIMKSPL